jgi:modulator of FtsH protease HflK
MERLFAGTDKIIVDSGAASGIVPYLPLDQLMRRPQTAPALK